MWGFKSLVPKGLDRKNHVFQYFGERKVIRALPNCRKQILFLENCRGLGFANIGGKSLICQHRAQIFPGNTMDLIQPADSFAIEKLSDA